MQISNVNAMQQAQTLQSTAKPKDTPAQEAAEQTAKAPSAAQQALAKSTGVGANIDIKG